MSDITPINGGKRNLPEDIEEIKKSAVEKFGKRQYMEALEDLNKANQLQPNDTFILRYRGATKRMLDDYKGALEDLNQAYERDSTNEFTLRYRGDTKRRLRDYEGALADLNKAIEKNPLAFTLRSRGDVRRSLGDYQGALEDLEAAHGKQPRNTFTLRYLGDIKRRLGDYKGALEVLNEADKLEPNYTFTLEQRAKVRYYLSEFEGALEDIEQVLKQHATEGAQRWKKKIEQKITKPKGRTLEHEGVIRVEFSALEGISDPLGEGGFGEVSLAQWCGMKVALKKLKPYVLVADDYHEAKSLTLFRCKFIVTLMGITTDPATNRTILIMEYMKHGSLEDSLFKNKTKLKRAEVIRLALDIALGINYLHSQTPKVLHRDLKSANVLMYRKKTRAKIADFGTAIFLYPRVQPKTVIGNVSIAMPPEMLAEAVYDEKVDVFAFGVILYEMLTNKRLSIMEEAARIKRIQENVKDEELSSLVLACCASDPDKRPCMCYIIGLLRKLKSGQANSVLKD